ncbi:MAG TPA: nucleotide exchange factor GrpE [Chloroflexota bacterium]|nr:nucleotide exchange factor GrpE [Chloroflexota bacterium]
MMDETTTRAGTQAVEPPLSQDDQAQPDRVTELEAALAAAKAEAAENWDKYLRERADMDNYKKRIERTYADLTKRGRKELLTKVVGAVDNLERALAYESNPSQEADTRNLATGLRMVYLQFKELLASEGLTEVKTVGEQFDPRVHEAVVTEVVEGKSDGEILEELQKGYTMGDELLRPARVKVATKER